MGKDELWALCKDAHRQYQIDVIQHHRCYTRYMTDFISYRLLPSSWDIAEWRFHLVNIFRMYDLLHDREDLVNTFFTQPDYTEESHRKLVDLFFTGKPVAGDESHKGYVCLHKFSDAQLLLITEFVNDKGLFMTKVEPLQLSLLFACSGQVCLRARHNGRLLYFFNCLQHVGLLPGKWQRIVEEYRLIASSKDGTAMNATRISTSINTYMKHAQDLKEYIQMAKTVKDMETDF